MSQVKREVWECSVSLSWILDFAKTKEEELKGLSTQQVVDKVIIPETKDSKCRYVDLLECSNVSTPTYFASHVWASPFLDLVRSLSEHLAPKTNSNSNEYKSIFIWIDIFAVNQHKDVSQQNDLKNLHLAVKNSVLGTLVCLDLNGVLLTRIWCLFEIWHTLKADGRNLKIVAHQIEYKALKEVFANCDVAKAEATVAADKDRILKEIKATTTFSKMNKKIKKALVDSAKNEAESNSKLCGTDPIKAAKSFEKYGLILAFTGKTERAAILIKQSLNLFKSNCGPKHMLTATSLYYSGNLAHDTGKYEDAINFYEESLSIYYSLPSIHYSFISSALVDLGQTYLAIEKFEQSLVCYQNAIAVVEKFEQAGLEMARCLASLGGLYSKMTNYQQAELVFKQALDITEKVCGTNNLQTANSYEQLGLLYYNQEDYYLALPLHNTALEIRKQCFGDKHQLIGKSLNNLALVYSGLNEHENALSYFDQCLNLHETFIDGHDGRALVLMNKGCSLMDLERLEEAILLFEEAIVIFKKNNGEVHQSVATATQNAANAYHKLRNYSKALAMFLEALFQLEKIFGSSLHLNIATTHSNLCSLLEDMGRFEEALSHAKQSLLIREKLHANYEDIVTSLEDTIVLLGKLGRHQEAIPYQVRLDYIKDELLDEIFIDE